MNLWPKKKNLNALRSVSRDRSTGRFISKNHVKAHKSREEWHQKHVVAQYNTRGKTGTIRTNNGVISALTVLNQQRAIAEAQRDKTLILAIERVMTLLLSKDAGKDRETFL